MNNDLQYGHTAHPSPGVAIDTVRVRMLTLGRKRMTRALYQQIFEESPIDRETGAFAGTLLGKINVHDRDCRAADAPAHVHVLWLKGDELRRCRVFQAETQTLFALQRADTRRALDETTTTLACTVYVVEGEEELAHYFTLAWDDETQSEVPDRLYLRLTERTHGRAWNPAYSNQPYRDEETIAQRAKSAEEIPALLDLAHQQAHSLEAWENKARGVWLTLTDLPQLFIAG